MIVTTEQLTQIAGRKPSKSTLSNMNSVVVALDKYGQRAGLHQLQRLSHFLAQMAHESGGFYYDTEVWGPTPAQARYDTRVDLGNTPAKDGDGEKYKGRGPTQLTGRSNYQRFTKWCADQGYNPPDFVKYPEKVNTDPWEGLSAIWYWSVGNPTGKSLNAYADENNIQQITKKINGGLNGYSDRVRYYVRASLVLLGFGPTEVKKFQAFAQKSGWLPPGDNQIDGDAGPLTMAAMHMALAEKSGRGSSVKPSPVTTVETETVEVEKEVPVVVEGATKRGFNWLLAVPGILSAPLTWFFELDRGSQIALGSFVAALFLLLLWRGEWLIARTKTLLRQIGE